MFQDITDCVTTTDESELLDWAESVNQKTVIIIDRPGAIDNDMRDYRNLKLFPWQSVLRDKMAAGLLLIVWIEHTSRAQNNSIFSDSIQAYNKRLAIGGQGDRHPFFMATIELTNVYLKDDEAFISFDGNSADKIKLAF